MQLIHYGFGKRSRGEVFIGPVESRMIYEAGMPMDTIRLPCRARVRKRPRSIDIERVVIPQSRGDFPDPPTIRL